MRRRIEWRRPPSCCSFLRITPSRTLGFLPPFLRLASSLSSRHVAYVGILPGFEATKLKSFLLHDLQCCPESVGLRLHFRSPHLRLYQKQVFGYVLADVVLRRLRCDSNDSGPRWVIGLHRHAIRVEHQSAVLAVRRIVKFGLDRKSTRLNSSHITISY